MEAPSIVCTEPPVLPEVATGKSESCPVNSGRREQAHSAGENRSWVSGRLLLLPALGCPHLSSRESVPPPRLSERDSETSPWSTPAASGQGSPQREASSWDSPDCPQCLQEATWGRIERGWWRRAAKSRQLPPRQVPSPALQPPGSRRPTHSSGSFAEKASNWMFLGSRNKEQNPAMDPRED